MIIRLLFYEDFEGEKVRAVGIYREFTLDDGSRTISLDFLTEEIPENRSRIDVIGLIEEDTLKVERRRYIGLEEEFYRRAKAMEIMREKFGSLEELIEEIIKAIVSVLSETDGLSRGEIVERLKELGYKNKLLIFLAIEEAHRRGTILEITPGVYVT